MADTVELRFAREPGIVLLRELNGFDERSVEASNTGAAIALLDRLLEEGSATCEAADLPAADRDRLLAAVYRRAYSDRVESSVHCARCSALFELSFSLDTLRDTLDAQSTLATMVSLEDGAFRSPDGLVFRLPSGRDEMEVARLAPDAARRALHQRCYIAGDADLLEETLESVAPVFDLDLDARCPECGHNQQVHFDMQSYLLGALLKERRRLLSEVHRIAVTYGWSRREILELARSERRVHLELIEADVSRRARVSS